MSNQPTVKPPIEPLIVGKIGSAYGIRGWLRMFSSTEKAEAIFGYQPWFIQRAGQWQLIELEEWKRHNQDIIIKVNGISDRNAAEVLTNFDIVVDSVQFPVLESGDYYWKDLVGCQVFTTKGYQLGRVTQLMETGSNDVLIVKANLKDAFGIKERLIPFLSEQVIKHVDLTEGKIEVDWDPGF